MSAATAAVADAAPRLDLLEEVARDFTASYGMRSVHSLPDPGAVTVDPDFRASVRANGVFQPIWLSPTGDTIYDGLRRVAAAKAELAPNRLVPVMWGPANRRAGAVLTLLGNWARSQNPIAEAWAIRRLVVDDGIPVDAIAKELHTSRARIEKLLRLALAAPWIREAALTGAIAPTVAVAAAALETGEQIALEATFRTSGALHHRDVRAVRRREVAAALDPSLFAGPSHAELVGVSGPDTLSVPTDIAERTAALLHRMLKADGVLDAEARMEGARLAIELESVLVARWAE